MAAAWRGVPGVSLGQGARQKGCLGPVNQGATMPRVKICRKRMHQQQNQPPGAERREDGEEEKSSWTPVSQFREPARARSALKPGSWPPAHGGIAP